MEIICQRMKANLLMNSFKRVSTIYVIYSTEIYNQRLYVEHMFYVSDYFLTIPCNFKTLLEVILSLWFSYLTIPHVWLHINIHRHSQWHVEN